MKKLMVKMVVRGTPPSLNKMYAGVHWSKRVKMADEWHLILLHAFRRFKVPKPLKTPIIMRVTQVSKKIRDCDNAILSAKFCGDALVKYKYIPDDSPVEIQEVQLRSESGKKDMTIIELYEPNSIPDHSSAVDGSLPNPE